MTPTHEMGNECASDEKVGNDGASAPDDGHRSVILEIRDVPVGSDRDCHGGAAAWSQIWR